MLSAIEFMAVVVACIYGILRASREKMDFVGLFSIAFCVAFGGGTLRDLFLDRHPLFWIDNSHYPVVVFLLALIGALTPKSVARLERYLVLPDALGLGLFSIVGAAYALDAGTSLFVASIFGVMTGTFGGVIADITCNQVPTLFRTAPLYATCSFVGAWVYLLLTLVDCPHGIATTSGIVLIVAMRMIAVRWNITLPTAYD